jgi:cation transport regulator ChaB
MKKNFFYLSIFCFCLPGVFAQGIQDAETTGSQVLPVTKISIYSSGLAYYEHTGALNGAAVIRLPFKENAVNDALMSLVLNDSASASPSVSYQSPNTLFQTLRSLKIDLSDEADMAGILRNLRGAEVEITAPSPVSGKIMGVEYRSRISPSGIEIGEQWLSLYTEQGIRRFNFNEIISINFKDPAIEADLKRALDLIAASRNNDSRDLTIQLPGTGSRKVSISYVIPSPVWKVSYRLDLGSPNAKPRLQGWAIVDNDGDVDWNKVELSLLAGRPSSFIQNLYPPYYVYRPTLPLAIAGAANAVTHDQSYVAGAPPVPRPESVVSARARVAMSAEAERDYDVFYEPAEKAAAGVIGTTISGAAAAVAGEQFEFTIKNPVSVARQMSAMLPLTDASVDARKLLIFSGSGPTNRNLNPRLGAELTNTSGIKLPAGPITVYDGGTYAGDALIEFWNEGEKRLISYGEDLSVIGAVTNSSSATFSSVTITGGTMTITRSQEFLTTYTFKNNAAQDKLLIIEHPKNQGTTLVSLKADEETPSLYRFTVTLPAKGELSVPVSESRPIMERVTLLQLRPEAFLSYASNRELPANVRDSLQQAVNLRSALNAAQAAVTDAEKQRTGFVSEQDRIRKNLEAAGSQTQQGQEYLKRLISLDDSIDRIDAELQALREKARSAQKAYEDYLGNLKQ